MCTQICCLIAFLLFGFSPNSSVCSFALLSDEFVGAWLKTQQSVSLPPRKLSQKLQQEATWGWGLGEFENSWSLNTIDELPPLELWISDNIKASNKEEITQLCESCTWLKTIKKRMFPIGWQNYRNTWSGCKSSAASCARHKQQKASDERRQRHARMTKQQPLGISRKNTEKRWKTSAEMKTESRKNMRREGIKRKILFFRFSLLRHPIYLTSQVISSVTTIPLACSGPEIVWNLKLWKTTTKNNGHDR